MSYPNNVTMDCPLHGCVARHRAGDASAAAELIRFIDPVVRRILKRHLPRRETLEDMRQEVLLKVFTRMNQYEGRAPFSHWVASVARGTCFDHLRAQRRRPELRMADLSESEIHRLELHPMPAPPAKDPTVRELVSQLIERLNTRDRLLVTLFHFRENSITEIAGITRVSETLVKTRLLRARRKLRQLFLQMPAHDRTGRTRGAGVRLVTTKRSSAAPAFSLPRLAA
jgi:RNA polymerase sigma factor (sigma-70 family)